MMKRFNYYSKNYNLTTAIVTSKTLGLHYNVWSFNHEQVHRYISGMYIIRIQTLAGTCNIWSVYIEKTFSDFNLILNFTIDLLDQLANMAIVRSVNSIVLLGSIKIAQSLILRIGGIWYWSKPRMNNVGRR